MFNCTAVELHLHVDCTNTEAFIVSLNESLCSLDVSLCPVLSAIALHLFPHSKNFLNLWQPRFDLSDGNMIIVLRRILQIQSESEVRFLYDVI
jgi:hypothetical protein